MSAASKTAWLAGGSGLVGRHLLELLLSSGHYSQVVSLGRRSLTITHMRLVQKRVDFAELGRDLSGMTADSVFCCLGTTIRQAGSEREFARVDAEYVGNLAAAAKTAGASTFCLVSSVGAAASASSFYLRVKADAEGRVEQARITTTHVFRPSLLLGSRAEERPLERAAQATLPWLRPLLLGRLRRYRAVAAPVLARAMLTASVDVTEAGVHVYESDAIERLGRTDEG